MQAFDYMFFKLNYVYCPCIFKLMMPLSLDYLPKDSNYLYFLHVIIGAIFIRKRQVYKNII